MTEKAAFCKLMGTLVASSVSSWATQPVQWGSTISDGFRIFRFHIESAWKNFGGMPSPTLAITGGFSDIIVQCDIMRHSLWQKTSKIYEPLHSFAIVRYCFHDLQERFRTAPATSRRGEAGGSLLRSFFQTALQTKKRFRKDQKSRLMID